MKAFLLGRQFPLSVFLIMLLGVLLVQVLFIGPNYVTGWTFAKPVSIVKIAEETGRIEFGSPEVAEDWIGESIAAHANRWGTTLIFLTLHYATGIDVDQWGSSSPVGVVFFLLALLFLFSKVQTPTSGPAKAAFVIAALGLLLNYQALIWYYHGGGWPGISLSLLMIGSLLAYAQGGSKRLFFAFLVIVFLLVQFSVYHAAAVMSFVLLGVLGAYALALRAVSHLKGAPPAFRVQMDERSQHFLNLAMIAAVMVYMDPVFSFLVGGFGPALLAPVESVSNFFVSYFEGANFFSPYHRGFALETRMAMFAPLILMLAASTFLWLRGLADFWKNDRLSEGQFIAHGLYVTAVVVLAVSTMFGGFPRATEPYFLLLLGFPLLLFLPRSGSLPGLAISKGKLLVGLGMVVLTAFSLVTVMRDPFVQISYASSSEIAASKWAARTIDVHYFADGRLASLVLMNDPHAPIISPSSLLTSLEELDKFFYAGAQDFATGLRARGAQLALLSNRNIEGQGVSEASIITPEYPLRPLPDYDFTSEHFEIVYDNGDSKVIGPVSDSPPIQDGAVTLP